jgi:hypothetical protein
VWPRHRLIVECDSGWHDNPVSARDDAERDEPTRDCFCRAGCNVEPGRRLITSPVVAPSTDRAESFRSTDESRAGLWS